jgi:hypothetical protein
MKIYLSAFVWLPVLALVGIVACSGGPDTVPIDQVPPDKKVVDLSGPEQQGVCQWAEGIASQKLPPGTNCHGAAITIGGCVTVGPTCPATVAQWKTCFPALMDRFAQDPCQVLNLGFSTQANLAMFINATPGCEGQGACGVVIRM